MTQKEHGTEEVFVVDGLNVCNWWGKVFRDQVSTRPLLVLLSEILENGDDFFCVFDATIAEQFCRYNKDKELSVIQWLLSHQKKRFYRVTAGAEADAVILHHADKFGCRVITNDLYRDYIDSFPWVSVPKTRRILRGNFQRSGLLTVTNLKYGGMDLDRAVETRHLFARLERAIAVHDNPAITPVMTRDIRASAETHQEGANMAPVALAGDKSRTSGGKTSSASTTRKRSTPRARKVLETASRSAKKKWVTRTRSVTKKRASAAKQPKKARKKTVRRRRSPPPKKGWLSMLFG